MRFWPGEDYTIRVKGSATDALKMLSVNTLPGKPTLGINPLRNYEGKPFLGQVTPDSFEVIPVPAMSAFQPVFRGRLRETGDETEISVKMRLNETGTTFLLVWMSLCAAIMLLILSHIQNTPFNFGMLMPLVLSAFALGLAHFSFWLAVKPCRQRLNMLLGAGPVTGASH